MKQKFLILKDEDKNELIIREFAELDKENFSLLCEETYDNKTIESAIKKGKRLLISTLGTKNMYPPGLYADKIAESVMAIYSSESDQPVELFFDDIDLVKEVKEEPEILDIIEEESEEIFELLEEDSAGEDIVEKKTMGKIKSSIKIADDESLVDAEDS
ncbi:MAG: hypothetical protein V3T59_03770 [Desulfobacterales bacterium]